MHFPVVADIDELKTLITSMRLASVQLQAVKKLLQTEAFESDVLKVFFIAVTEHLQPEGKVSTCNVFGL